MDQQCAVRLRYARRRCRKSRPPQRPQRLHRAAAGLEEPVAVGDASRELVAGLPRGVGEQPAKGKRYCPEAVRGTREAPRVSSRQSLGWGTRWRGQGPRPAGPQANPGQGRALLLAWREARRPCRVINQSVRHPFRHCHDSARLVRPPARLLERPAFNDVGETFLFCRFGKGERASTNAVVPPQALGQSRVLGGGCDQHCCRRHDV
mmetsp:Transcript_56164/g.156444  ORF Transcript_56164/g.156444 Transcript_56164/m.156444 type:complete len:206 (-) Transcript_56164:424-1041(-)